MDSQKLFQLQTSLQLRAIIAAFNIPLLDSYANVRAQVPLNPSISLPTNKYKGEKRVLEGEKNIVRKTTPLSTEEINIAK